VGVEPEGSWQGAGGALQPEVASAAAEVDSRTLLQKQKPSVRTAFVFGIQVGIEPEGSWQGAGGALQPEVASAAAEVDSRTLLHVKTTP